MSTAPVSTHALAEIYKISHQHLLKWEKEGIDIRDLRLVVSKIWGLRKKPPEWVSTFTKLAEGESDDTHEAWKKRKTMAEALTKEVALAKSRGESFDRSDGESVMAAIASALNLSLTEMQAMLPPQLEGLDATGIEIVLGKEIHKMRETLGNLETELWTRVYEHYTYENTDETSPAAPAMGGDSQSPAEAKRIKVVRAKRQTGSGAGS